MKPLRILATASVALVTSSLFVSCGSSGDKKEEKKDTAATTTQVETPPAPVEPSDQVVLKMKVADFNKWKSNFESNDSARAAYGLTKFAVGRGIDDSNMVIVYLKMDNVGKAKEFAASPALKERMKKGGVTSKPDITFIDVVMLDESVAATSKDRLLVHHKVKDWAAWKQVFDSDKPNRVSAGLFDRGLSHVVGDDHDVYIVFVVTDMAKTKAMANSKELKAKMDSAGVEGKPSFFYYTIAARY